jgi:16S rRNA (cytidine1402-2'-O)-methyltransferase
MIDGIRSACGQDLMLVVAADLTLPTEEIVALPVAKWRDRDGAQFQNRPAIFLLGLH